jgi:hypothetical protein
MPLLVDDLSVWNISFRWAGLEPDQLWLRIPSAVKDNMRMLMDAILKGVLSCETITLEKRNFEPDEKFISVYHWIDDFYDCIHGNYYNRKMLRWAQVDRFDFMLWCERMKAPLPEFWFPPGWNLEYDLPEGHLPPGYFYMRRDWTAEDWKAWHAEQAEMNLEKKDDTSQPSSSESEPAQSSETPTPSTDTSKIEAAVEKMRPNQEARIACQQIAKVIWEDEPDRTIASVVIDDLIQKYGGGHKYVDETVREWVKVVAPPHVSNRRGAPRKNRAEGK